MLKNISVSVKGFAAFGILAVLAIGTSALIYQKAVDAELAVENNLRVMSIVQSADELSETATSANLSAKNFLLTGNRDYVKAYEETTKRFDEDAGKLTDLISENASQHAAAFGEARSAIEAWRKDVIDRQFNAMRDPATVELARALELTGEGAQKLETFSAKLAEVKAGLNQQATLAAEAQTAALSSVETISLLTAILTAIAALLMSFMNFQLISRPLGRISEILSRLANGDLNVPTLDLGKDEIGRMAETVKVFREEIGRAHV